MSERWRPRVPTVSSSGVRLCVARRSAATPGMSRNSSPSSPRDSRLSGLLPLFFETTIGDFDPVRGPAHQDRVHGLVVDTYAVQVNRLFAPTRTRTFVAIERREPVGVKMVRFSACA